MSAPSIPELRAAIRNADDLFHHAMRPTPPEELGIECRDHMHSLAIVIEAAKERFEQMRREPRRIIGGPGGVASP